MRGTKARALRKIAAGNRKAYRAMKRALKADKGQYPATSLQRNHKPKQAIKPTWPKTDDQKAQSRPLIVLQPTKRMCRGLKGVFKQQMRAACEMRPKHEIDAAVLRGHLL